MTTKNNPEPCLQIPIPIKDIPGLLKGADSTAGKFFKEAVLAKVAIALSEMEGK
jgi:hypothetical protein